MRFTLNEVATINAAFTPDAARKASAEAIVAAFSANPDAGALQLDGQIIDTSHLRHAQAILGRAEIR